MNIPETANKGLEGVVACTSEVSTIHDVTLLYRGYTIEDLAKNCSFEEVVYLLWNQKLPNQSELNEFRSELEASCQLPEEMFPFLKKIAATQAHSMAKLRTAISAYGMLDPKADDISLANMRRCGAKLTSAMSAIVSTISRYEQGLEPIPYQKGKSIAWNFLNMIRGKEPNAEELKLFDTALVLHADHELNASTFTARVVVSTNSDYYSSMTGAVCSLKGPLHGGANEQVMLMLREIGSKDKVEKFIDDAVNAKQKVMGIGHRVYKNGDPRAWILKDMAVSICKKTGLEELYTMAVRIQEQMEELKGLMPNVDFYSGLVYTALGIRARDFTPVFALSRVSGWTAQILEQCANNRIYRPRAHYTGKTGLEIKPISMR